MEMNSQIHLLTANRFRKRLQNGIHGYRKESKPDFEAKMLKMVENINSNNNNIKFNKSGLFQGLDRLSISSVSSA